MTRWYFLAAVIMVVGLSLAGFILCSDGAVLKEGKVQVVRGATVRGLDAGDRAAVQMYLEGEGIRDKIVSGTRTDGPRGIVRLDLILHPPAGNDYPWTVFLGAANLSEHDGEIGDLQEKAGKIPERRRQ